MNNPLLAIVGNHLWQSTLFAAAIWGLTHLLRRNGARVRYVLWLAASVKFLVPFAVIAAGAAQIPWSTEAAGPSALPVAIKMAGDFASPLSGELELIPGGLAAADRAAGKDWTLTLLGLLIWAGGATFVAMRWLSRWLKIRSALRTSQVVQDVDFPTTVRVTTEQFEPGVVGIVRPVLLLPEGIRERLSPVQLEAVLAHERCHLRWRDNLAAAVHMRIEVLFWFFPPVWWIGARLIEERERACDEQVLREGHVPKEYAEGILAVCEHYIASRLSSVSGVSGADLRIRIESIARNLLTLRLSRTRRLAIAAVGGCTLAAPIAAGMMSGNSLQVLFSFKADTTAQAGYVQLLSASWGPGNDARSAAMRAGFAPGAFFSTGAATCPSPTRELEQKQRALAATVTNLVPRQDTRALLYAVAANSAPEVRRLLAAGAPRTGDGFFLENSLMHIAARLAGVEVMQLLAEGGISINGLSDGGIGANLQTPLMISIDSGRKDNVEWLIRNGADLNARSDLGSALTIAMISCRDRDLVARLIRAGAQPGDRDLRIARRLGIDLGVPGGAN